MTLTMASLQSDAPLRGRSGMTSPHVSRHLRSPHTAILVSMHHLGSGRLGFWFAAFLFVCFGSHPSANGEPAGIRTDWLKLVPGDAKLYVELRNLAGIRDQFRGMGIWDAIRQLSAPNPATSQPWHVRAEQ